MNGHGLWKVRSWSLVLAPWLDKNTGTIHKDKEFRRINRYGEVGRNNLSMRYCESLEQVTVLATWGLPTFVVCLVVRSYLTLCNLMDYILPGSSVHGISQARILEWVAITFSRESWYCFNKYKKETTKWLIFREVYTSVHLTKMHCVHRISNSFQHNFHLLQTSTKNIRLMIISLKNFTVY